MRMSSIVERPMCLTCKHRMGLARISPGERGFEERTFECRTCHRIEKISSIIDPMKTDAVGLARQRIKAATPAACGPGRWGNSVELNRS